MPKKITKILSFLLCFVLIFQQTGFAQAAAVELNLSGYFSRMASNLAVDKFRPLHLRYLSYDALSNNFNLLLDKGDQKGTFPKGTPSEIQFKEETKKLLNYFFIGLALPNESFWVNLRPDSPDNIIDDQLAKTDIGRIFLEADLQLKKDTALFTSPQTPEGREYWDRLYKKAGELYGYDSVTIPTLTRPWIVPNEIIVREAKDSAYIYKATLKVMLESDYLRDGSQDKAKLSPGVYAFNDERSKALNEYSSQLIRELIIPKLTKGVNSSKRYAPLRQVYYSLILAQWFKQKFPHQQGHSLTDLASKEDWSKTTYFNAYKQSFAQGEYNIKEPVYTPTGQVIRSYFSGGIKIDNMSPVALNIAGSPLGNNPYLMPVAYRNGIDTQPLSSSPLSQRPDSHNPIFSTDIEAVKESIRMKPLRIFNTSGKRVRVFLIDGRTLLNVPTYYDEEVYDEDGIALITIRKTKIDHRKYIKPGYDLALKKIGNLIPAMREIRDFHYIDERGHKKYEEWGYLQERLPFTLGERLRQLYNERQWEKIEEYRRKFVAYQYAMWESGVWDYDLNILENYGVNEEDNIELLDIDNLSVTNDFERYLYNPRFYLELRHHPHWSTEYQNIAYDFIAPILEQLQVNEFNKRINRENGASPVISSPAPAKPGSSQVADINNENISTALKNERAQRIFTPEEKLFIAQRIREFLVSHNIKEILSDLGVREYSFGLVSGMSRVQAGFTNHSDADIQLLINLPMEEYPHENYPYIYQEFVRSLADKLGANIDLSRIGPCLYFAPRSRLYPEVKSFVEELALSGLEIHIVDYKFPWKKPYFANLLIPSHDLFVLRYNFEFALNEVLSSEASLPVKWLKEIKQFIIDNNGEDKYREFCLAEEMRKKKNELEHLKKLSLMAMPHNFDGLYLSVPEPINNNLYNFRLTRYSELPNRRLRDAAFELTGTEQGPSFDQFKYERFAVVETPGGEELAGFVRLGGQNGEKLLIGNIYVKKSFRNSSAKDNPRIGTNMLLAAIQSENRERMLNGKQPYEEIETTPIVFPAPEEDGIAVEFWRSMADKIKGYKLISDEIKVGAVMRWMREDLVQDATAGFAKPGSSPLDPWKDPKRAEQLIKSLPDIGLHGLPLHNFLSVMGEKSFHGNVALINEDVKKLSVNRFTEVLRNDIRMRVLYGIRKMQERFNATERDLGYLPVILFINTDAEKEGWQYPNAFAWGDEGFDRRTINEKLLGYVELSINDYDKIRDEWNDYEKRENPYPKDLSRAHWILERMTDIMLKRTLDLFEEIAENRQKPALQKFIESRSGQRKGSSPLEQDLGGVDMRHLAKNAIIEKQGQSPAGTVPVFASKELEEIQRLIQAGIIPATKRLEECRGACSSEALLSCIADILRIEEERATQTEAGLKNLLASL